VFTSDVQQQNKEPVTWHISDCLIFFSQNVMIWRNEGDNAESYCSGYIVAAEHEAQNIDSSG